MIEPKGQGKSEFYCHPIFTLGMVYPITQTNFYRTLLNYLVHLSLLVDMGMSVDQQSDHINMS